LNFTTKKCLDGKVRFTGKVCFTGKNFFFYFRVPSLCNPDKSIRTITFDGGCACFDFVNTVDQRLTTPVREYLRSYDDMLVLSERLGLLPRETLAALGRTRPAPGGGGRGPGGNRPGAGEFIRVVCGGCRG
jgi:hypothetical protein